LATPGCEEYHRLDCLGPCDLRILTTNCCGKDKCGHCSVWHIKSPESQVRLCGRNLDPPPCCKECLDQVQALPDLI
jgi:hypothetical protein